MAADKEILFIHIPKSAGVSISQALVKKVGLKTYGPHFKCKHLFYPQGDLERENYFVFTFVRNPWERLVSTFYYIMKGGRAEIDARRRDLYLSKYQGDFSKFVLDIKNWIDIREDASIYPDRFIPHFRPQFEYIFDDQGNNMVDFIGRFENIGDDFRTLCTALSIDAVKLPTSNRSSHGRYHKYYDHKTMEIVADFYAKDIELFDYQFGKAKPRLGDLFSFGRR